MPKPNSLLKGFERTIATAKRTAKRQVHFDPETTGLALIVSPKGKQSFYVVARPSGGKQVWKQIGDPASMTVTKARAAAIEAVQRIKAGEAPLAPPEAAPKTFKQVAEDFIKRWVAKGGKKQDGTPLRSKREVERQFKAYIYPRWETKPFHSIRRGAVTELMDELVDNNGAVMADRVLATLNKMFNWYRQYDENYVNPVIPEMKRSGSYVSRARKRILNDDEIRTLWTACDEIGTFGSLVKIALLTGQRRAKVATMRRADIREGVWVIPSEAREKVNAGELKLPRLALDIIDVQPEIEGNPYVFAGRGKKAFNSFSDGMKELKAKAPIDHWTLHDLRRTARSLMARAGVRREIAERTLGHVISGVEGVYDRHAYRDEKGEALRALAKLINCILKGDGGNVVQIARAAQ